MDQGPQRILVSSHCRNTTRGLEAKTCPAEEGYSHIFGRAWVIFLTFLSLDPCILSQFRLFLGTCDWDVGGNEAGTLRQGHQIRMPVSRRVLWGLVSKAEGLQQTLWLFEHEQCNTWHHCNRDKIILKWCRLVTSLIRDKFIIDTSYAVGHWSRSGELVDLMITFSRGPKAPSHLRKATP